MHRVAVLADTVTEIPKELAEEYNIKLAPVNIVIDGKSCPEDEILKWYRAQMPKWNSRS